MPWRAEEGGDVQRLPQHSPATRRAPEVYKVPKIAGQGSKYLVTALMGYRKGERRHPTHARHRRQPLRPGHGRPRRYYEQLGKSPAR